MNIRNYLEAKYGVRNATTILACEARVFGIPKPLRSGWLKEHGDTVITADTARRLRAALEKNGTPSAQKGLEILNIAWIELKTGKKGKYTSEYKENWYHGMIGLLRQRGKNEDRAYHLYREKFGIDPAWKKEAGAITQDVVSYLQRANISFAKDVREKEETP